MDALFLPLAAGSTGSNSGWAWAAGLIVALCLVDRAMAAWRGAKVEDMARDLKRDGIVTRSEFTQETARILETHKETEARLESLERSFEQELRSIHRTLGRIEGALQK
jgi:hypothetical protein